MPLEQRDEAGDALLVDQRFIALSMRRSRSDEMPTDSGVAVARSRTLFSTAFIRVAVACAASRVGELRVSGTTTDSVINPSASDRKWRVIRLLVIDSGRVEAGEDLDQLRNLGHVFERSP